MAESHGAVNDAGRPTTSGTTSGPLSVLACYACKRRKVKCNRQLPTCSLCQKLNGACEYPIHPEKPGPKTGSLHRTKRRRLDGPSGSSDASLSDGRQVSPSTCYSARQDASQPETNMTTPDRAVGASPPTTERRGSHPTAPIFSRIMYPSHEAQTRPQSPSTVDTSPTLHQHAAVGITVDSVCAALKISRNAYDVLMSSYFTNMTFFSLFRPGSIEPKFAMMQSHSEAEALIAAMFSFSARHCRDAAGEHASEYPSPSYFSNIASAQLDESVDRYGDMRPPFWLLQAGILVTFYQLTLSVRSRSWKKLGDCIRYSYDLNMHLVDANHDPTPSTDRSTVDIQRWALLEERRRAWWAVWEMDVFASTIRRLPTAIDESLNLTLLPVPDSCWFNDIYQESCFLVEDCSLRWKHLVQSGNQSSKSWFIVMNSLMRNTQRIVYPAGSAIKSLNDKYAETNRNELDIMANCVYCTVASLPTSLTYQGETLDFRPRSSSQDSNSRQEHADKYSIHLMTQLCRFMIYHHKICARAPWLTPKAMSAQEPSPSAHANSEWSNYMSASDEIVLVVRNSSRDHYKYVNPFLANTLWFAAAAQCACKVFGPPFFNKRLSSSNLDLLKLTIDRFISFWNGTENLKGKLARIEVGLKNLMAGTADTNGAADGTTTRRETQDAHNDVDGLTKRSAVVQGLSSPGSTTQFSMQGPDALILGVPSNGWVDPSSPAFVPDLCDFTQPFTMTGQNFFSADPTDVSPFRLEELLMTNMVQHM